MKILFVTGGEDCECKGDGFESVTLYPWGLGKDPKTGEPRSVTTRILCSCVEAREATIETVKARLPQRNIEAGKDEMVPVMVHRVVPEGWTK